MMQTLAGWDTALFLYLNGMHARVLDAVMYAVSSRYTWIPVAVVLLGLVIVCLRRRAPPVLLALALVVGVVAYVESGVLKPGVGRLRPCQDPALAGKVHLVGACPASYSFPSGHAANAFAVATFLWLGWRRRSAHAAWLLAYAALIAYSRIYLGVHYPGDVVAGALLGAAAATLAYLALPEESREW